MDSVEDRGHCGLTERVNSCYAYTMTCGYLADRANRVLVRAAKAALPIAPFKSGGDEEAGSAGGGASAPTNPRLADSRDVGRRGRPRCSCLWDLMNADGRWEPDRE